VSGQVWDAERYRANAAYVSDLAAPVLDLLDPRPGERVLDLGCGDGTLARRLMDAGCDVTAVDASPELVAAARAAGVEAAVGDARALAYDEEFDAVFSNAVLHWIREADTVVAGVYRALRPGGRFVAELGGHGNVGAIRDALVAELDRRGYDGAAHDPWYFPTAEDYAERLGRAGFVVERVALVPRPTPLPAGMEGFVATFGGSFVSALPREERTGYVADVCARLEGTSRDADGTWVAHYVRLRFAATKPV